MKEYVLAMIFCCIGLWVGFCFGLSVQQSAAVRAGVAEFYLDTHHVRQWRYLTNR